VQNVQTVVEYIIKTAGNGTWKDISKEGQLHEASKLILDISKAIHYLNWKPILTFKETIKMTTDWYLNYTRQDVIELTQNQIIAFTEKWNSLKEN
jgi:CDP-glucose 4,6-dehydratase